MNISLGFRRTTALAAGAMALGLGAFAAAPAQAQSATPLAAANAAVSTHGTAGVTADVVCDTIFSNGTNILLCSVGTYYDGGKPYRWPVTALNTSLSKNRVWFHQNPDGSGWNKCYSGGGSYTITGKYQDPGNIQVSSNTSPCP